MIIQAIDANMITLEHQGTVTKVFLKNIATYSVINSNSIVLNIAGGQSIMLSKATLDKAILGKKIDKIDAIINFIDLKFK